MIAKNLKILIVITKSEIGGAQVFVLNLVRELINRGFIVEVAAGEGDYLTEELAKLKVTFHYLHSLKRNISLLSHISFCFDFLRLIKKRKYDLIHLNSSNTLTAVLPVKMIKPVPKVLFTFHGLSLLDKDAGANPMLKFFAGLYFKFFLRIVDETVFVSQVNYEESIENKTVKHGAVIYNGLDASRLNYLDKDEARKFFSNHCNHDFSNSFILGSTGRIAYQKNYEFLISNFDEIREKIPDIKIIIIGEGPNLIPFRNLIEEKGIASDIFLVGPIKDSYKYVKAFDVFTLPSRYEGLSISLIEALFAEIPILATDVGGNFEIVGEGSEQLFKLNDISDFILKLNQIITNKESIVVSNVKMLKNFNLDSMIEKYIELYNKLVLKKS